MARAESMRYQTFLFSARDSSHKFTPQGVKLLSSATMEKAAEALSGISRTFYASANIC